MSGRLVQPCSACGTMLRLSAMRLFTALGALGLIATSIARSFHESEALLFLALVCAILILVGMIWTRVEAVRQITQEQSVKTT
jgi:FtsH-binding integral membrane protein